MDVANYVNVLVAGLVTGAIYGVLALSYNVIFATTGILNFAQGEFFMMGSVVGAFLFEHHWPAGLALIVVVVFGAVIGGLVERVAVRPALSKGNRAFGWVLSTLGVSLVLTALAAIWTSDNIKAFPSIFPNTRWSVGGVTLSPTDVSLVAALLVLGTGLHFLYNRTVLGKALGAVAQDREAAEMRGIPVGRLSTLSFALGAALAALIGFLAGPLTAAYASIGLVFGFKGFIAAALGGLPSTRGAVTGGLLLGVLESFGGYFFGAGYESTVVFAVLILVLVARPVGLFGSRSARAV